MPKWVEFTLSQGEPDEPVVLNVDHITAYHVMKDDEEQKPCGTYIEYIGGDAYVQESFAEVDAKIREATA